MAVLKRESLELGRIRLALIPDASSDSLIPFVKKNVVPGSTVITDGWKGYSPLTNEGFIHIDKPMKSGEDMLSHVHLSFSLLKRWLIGTFQGRVQHKYLEFYLDEFVFRLNRRKSHSLGKLFRRLIEQSVLTPPITRKKIKIENQAEAISNDYIDDIKDF
jgi:transposase-like protein